MWKRRKHVIVAVAVGAVLLYFFYYTSNPRMILPFSKVSGLSREVVFVSVFDEKKVLLSNISKNKGSWHKEISESVKLGNASARATNVYHQATIATTPDGMRVFVCANDELGEFDTSGTLLRRILIDEFKLTTDGRFGEMIQAANDRLWLSVGEQIIEWQTDKHPSTRLLAPGDGVFMWIADPVENRIFLVGVKCGILNLDTNKFLEKAWQNKGTFCDFVQNKGLLLSGAIASGKEDRILKIDTSNDAEVDITWGAQAQWGCDGYIYFIRGSTHISRCKPDGGKVETVYSATRRVRGGKEGTGNELKFNHDRSLLAFYHKVPCRGAEETFGLFASKYDFGIVFIDLRAKEFMELTEDDFCRICLGMFSEGLISLSGAFINLKHRRVFWEIKNMALLTTDDANGSSIPTTETIKPR
ncbi:MAG: hypothetical protein FVQ85_03765 [Planctomycetes bacterium]|nr:hypothetical protein [Planctomycetota bacterium]